MANLPNSQWTIESSSSFEKRRAYRGTVKYPLQHLEEENTNLNPRQTDPKNIKRLLEIFKLEGCRRSEPRNRVPALISPEQYTRLIDGLPNKDLYLKDCNLEPPETTLAETLVCLHGKHRLEAARRYLGSGQKWWIVDLYSDDINVSAKAELREEHANARSFLDGDIYRHLRNCHLQNDLEGKRKWMARLSAAKRRDVLQLEKRAYADDPTREFTESLDKLLPFTGLWSALQLGTFHRLLSLRCPEEMTNYLKTIHRVWNAILGGSDILPGFLDSQTVNILQGRCPKLAEVDFILIKEKRRGLLPYLSNEKERDKLWDRICSVECVIPSIHTFLEDTKYLEPCARVMKELLTLEPKASICQAYERCHNGQQRIPIEVAEGIFEYVVCTSGAASFRLAYTQIWLFVMRHFPVLTGHCPRKNATQAKPWTSRGDSVIRWKLHVLAKSAGFERINTGVESWDDSCIKEIEKALTHFFPASIYSMTVKHREYITPRLRQFIKRYEPKVERRKPESLPEYTTNDENTSCGSDINFRCGVPFEQSFERDQGLLFLRYLYSTNASILPRRYLSSFAIKKDMVHCFFGEVYDMGASSDTPMLPENPPMETVVSPIDQIQNFQSMTTAQQQESRPLIDDRPNNMHSPSSKRAVSEEAGLGAPADTAPSTLVPYQAKHDFNSMLHTEEETIEIAQQWYQHPEPRGRIIIVQDKDQFYRIYRLALDDTENYERIISSRAIVVPDRLKRLKATGIRGAWNESGIFILDPADSKRSREALERIWELIEI
ncbi:MAG: hypothetical protein Q9209_003746 [Squamulea sp. 1 TL-2023]